MSTASPLPLQPLPAETVSQSEQQLLKQQVAARLQEHRQRRLAGQQAPLPGMEAARPRNSRGNRIADSVAERFRHSVSYRDFLQQEAEAATRKAEAAAEVARRNAEAIAEAQRQLLDDIEQWNRAAEAPSEAAPLAGLSIAETAIGAVSAREISPSMAEDLRPERNSRFASVATSASEPQTVAKGLPNPEPAATPQPEPAAKFKLPEILEPLEPPVPLPTNLIEFPRQLVAARKARPRLAEGPLCDDAAQAQLRIFEVDASSFSTLPTEHSESSLPEWSDIRLDSWQSPEQTAQPQVSFAPPLYTAPVSQRCMAAAVDACCVSGAFLLAVAAIVYVSPDLPDGPTAAISAAGMLLLFGVMYLFLCFTFSDATPGMRYARIGLCTFGDENPTRSAIRKRLLALLLSALPLGLGFAWALLDDDRLGWHDRISRIYQRAY